MRKQVKLSINDLHNIISEAVKTTLRNRLNEGSSDWGLYNQWQDLEEQVGAEGILQAVWNYFDSDTLKELVAYIRRENDLDYDDEEGYE